MPDPDSLLDRWITEQFEEWPVMASDVGAEGYDDRLGDFSEAGFVRRQRSDAAWVRRLDELAGASLSEEQRIDGELVRSELAGRAVLDDWLGWRRDPETYL